MTLTEFLLARIAEDEAASALGGSWTLEVHTYDQMASVDGSGIRYCVSCEDSGVSIEVGAHIARWDPARVLAECEAKRQIVSYAANPTIYRGGTFADSAAADGYLAAIADTLRILALPYADHPDYQQEWAL